MCTVCTAVEAIVHDSAKKFSTDVDSTEVKEKNVSNSIQDFNFHVTSIVENLNQIEEIPKNFELLYNDDSKKCFFSPEE